MITADTSVVVAAFASWHEAHEEARAAVARVDRLAAHVLIETFSVLTRLPPPNRAPANVVHAFLTRQFNQVPLILGAKAHKRLLDDSLRLEITGGAIYDALIAATARSAGATLLTRDERALRTYEAMAIEVEIVGG
jgi:predicted nucleic acid-binding protein